ncbi:MAG: methyltransferase domain-containing protein [Spirulinaceae cyanobacterium]
MTQNWNPQLYDDKHFFVAEMGAGIKELLTPQPEEKILDLGCGTGHLTQEIANQGAKVIGVDNSSEMIEEGKHLFPQLDLRVKDGEKLDFNQEFTAVFSNAALHWMKNAEEVIKGVNRALQPGGRFVAEFGGKGNIKTIVNALSETLKGAGYKTAGKNPWYFPGIVEYGTLLEKNGFELTFALLLNRPTLLQGKEGLRNWLIMFAEDSFLAGIPEEQKEAILQETEQKCKPYLYDEGSWYADYRRLRIMAVKIAEV